MAEAHYPPLSVEGLLSASAKVAENTRSGYSYDCSEFARWCAIACRGWLPASTETVLFYLVDLLNSGHKISTARRHSCAIAYQHRLAGFPSPLTPTVYQLLRAAQRLRAEHPRKMRALAVDELRQISEALRIDGSVLALRDRSILTLGFATALRRSSLCELRMEDVEFTDQGLVVAIRREKQDQYARGRLIGVPWGHGDTCAVQCLLDWLRVRGSAAGPVFVRLGPRRPGEALDGECVWRIVKKRVKLAGLDPGNFGGHSLRAGLATAAKEGGASDLAVAAQTGHKSLRVLQGYFRRTEIFACNVCTAAGL